MLRGIVPNIGRSTVFNILKKLCSTGEITRVNKGHFVSATRKEYSYELSGTAKEIVSFIKEQYPLVDFQIWELYQMNEFVNHLLAKNTIFIEVENMLDDCIFNMLFEKYPHVLYKPGQEEYYKYLGNETIVVQKLISEAPPCIGEYRLASLEKILVDLFGHGLPATIVSRSEYKVIYEDSFSRYNINQPRMFRYARRRNVEKKIKDFIRLETNITLEAENDR